MSATRRMTLGIALTERNPKHVQLMETVENWKAQGWNDSQILFAALSYLAGIATVPRPGDERSQIEFLMAQRPTADDTAVIDKLNAIQRRLEEVLRHGITIGTITPVEEPENEVLTPALLSNMKKRLGR